MFKKKMRVGTPKNSWIKLGHKQFKNLLKKAIPNDLLF